MSNFIISQANEKNLGKVDYPVQFDKYNRSSNPNKSFIDLDQLKQDIDAKIITADQASKIILYSYKVKQDGGHDGAAGMGFEAKFIYTMAGILGFSNPAGVADFIIKPGVVADLKTAGTRIGPYNFKTKQAAWDYFNSTKYPIKHATHIIYLSKFNGINELDAGVFSQPAWLKMLDEVGLLRVSPHGKKGNYTYGIAVQTFSHQPKKWLLLDKAVQAAEDPVHFFERMFKV